MAMTESERSKCEDIIHGHATAVVAGNLAPVPGLGTAIDTAALTTMTLALASVFNVSVSKTLATNIAVNELKKYVGKQVVKEFIKIIPGFGSFASAALTIGMIESAGWSIAEEFASQRA